MGTVETIALKHPVIIGGVTLTELTMRRPKVRDQLAVEKLPGTDGEREVRLFANLCEVDPAVIGELDLADHRQLQTAWAGFLS